uniref:Uncharacterized protein n=1 Tax=Triticum urartu TaxID=4572 RepID=A0A8R7TXU8_TRIUA
DGTPAGDQLLHELLDVVVRRPTLLQRAPRHQAELLRLLPHGHAVALLPHHSPDGFCDRLAGDHPVGLQARRVVLGADAHAHAEHLHHELLVVELVGVPRPRHHRHAGAHGLQRRVPPAMRHEPADGRVV